MDWEFTFLNWLQGLHTPIGDALMPLFSRLGDFGLVWILLAVVLLCIPKYRRLGLVVAAALLADLLLCNILIKPLVARTRPYDINTLVELIVAKPLDYSFPSGHTAAAFAAVSSMFFVKNRLWIPAGILAVLIAFSRMYLYVHYPTDILGGIVVGIVSGALGAAFVQKLLIKKKEWGK
ncbi:MAG: phosphatase PAP2 family protein [Lachnospiraceae bacterium]|nr:phosphatase PAP2 family protein [Lachnospiraceae bacterium]